MKVIFFGLGSIGQRHARLLLARGGCELFALRTGLSDAPALDFPVRTLASWNEIDAVRPDTAFITNPTLMHMPTALECAKRGMNLFIEKPLGGSTQGLDELVDMVRHKGVKTYVAYVLRFSPVILKLKELMDLDRPLHLQVEASSYLPTWRPGRDHMKSYSARKDLGGGVIFDLSHEIDYVHFLLGGIQDIDGQCGRRSTVTVDSEDYADMHIRASRGTANVHMSFFSQMNRRFIKADLEHQTVFADLLTGTIQCHRDKQIVQEFHFPVDRDELFRAQMEYFFGHLDQPRMMNDIFESADLFRKICAFRERAYA
jgi:predicted dehydrogenase